MKRKDFLIWGTLGFAALAIFALFLLFSGYADNLGIKITVFFAIYFGALAYLNLKKLEVITDEESEPEVALQSDGDFIITEQISYYKSILTIAVPVFITLSLWVAIDLNNLHNGFENSSSVLTPVVFLYKVLGYWPVLFAVPLTGIMYVFYIVRKMSKLKAAL